PSIPATSAVVQQLTLAPASFPCPPPPPLPYPHPFPTRRSSDLAPISGATTTSYTPTSSDAGSTLDAVVTATNTAGTSTATTPARSEEHTSELPSRGQLVCRLLLANTNGQQLTLAPPTWAGTPAP